MSRTGRWIAGLAVSLLAHIGAGATLWAAIRPDPVTEQPSPETRLDMQAMQLDRSEARASRPRPQTAPEAEADGTSLAPGAIPQSRARPADAPRQKAAPGTIQTESRPPLSANAETVIARPPTPEGIAPVAAPVALSETLAPRPEPARPAQAATEVAAPARPSGISLKQIGAAPVPAPAAALRSDLVRPAETTAAALPDTDPQPAAAPAAAPEVLPAPPTEAQAQSAAPAPAQATRVKAALAFPGGAGDVDPVSFAAFQSFMQPGDAGAETLRDGLAGLLARVPCSRLQVAFDPDTVTLTVKGHVPEDGLRAPVLDALRAQMGADIAVTGDILILPRPQCGALAGIADVGLPQSTDQITNPLLVGADTHTRVLDYVAGDRLWFDISAPDYAAFLYVDYFDAGGDVIHLSPNEYTAFTRAEAKAAARVGVRDAGDSGLQITVAPPFGQEIAVAFAASAPLYDGLRPLVEPAAPYLDWLKARVAEARAGDPDFKGEWVYFFVTTAAR